MSYEEAIQADVEGIGIVLWVGSPDDPPEHIFDEDFQKAWHNGMRIFPHANPHGPVFHYTRDKLWPRWNLVKGASDGSG